MSTCFSCYIIWGHKSGFILMTESWALLMAGWKFHSGVPLPLSYSADCDSSDVTDEWSGSRKSGDMSFILIYVNSPYISENMNIFKNADGYSGLCYPVIKPVGTYFMLMVPEASPCPRNTANIYFASVLAIDTTRHDQTWLRLCCRFGVSHTVTIVFHCQIYFSWPWVGPENERNQSYWLLK